MDSSDEATDLELEIEDIGELIKQFLNDPAVHHGLYLDSVNEEGMDAVSIVLLSVFFESYVNTQLKEFYRDKGLESEEIPDISRMHFNRVLKKNRDIGLISDEDYNIIDKIKQARNKYAHNLEYWSLDKTTKIEDEEKIEDAIALYERLLEERE